MNALLTAALEYARHRIRVLPLQWPVESAGQLVCSCGDPSCPSPAKHPRISRGCHAASDNPDVIRHWWGQWPGANVGLATSPIVALDVDPRHDGGSTMRDLLLQHGQLPHSWRFDTGGGWPLLFRCPAGSRIRNSAGKLGPGVDVRGSDGFIVAPPSLHVSGRRYAISRGHEIGTTPLAGLPEWIGRRLSETAAKPAAGPAEWRKITSETVPEGARNATLSRLVGHLLRRRIDPLVALDLCLAWNAVRCAPPLPEPEVLRTVNSIAKRELQRREAVR